MKVEDYRKSVTRISFGKRLPMAIYVYRDESTSFGEELDAVVADLVRGHGITSTHNVLKFNIDEPRISFLSYPNFFMDAHPALRHAITINLATGKIRRMDYDRSANQPILHRKETLLPPDHPKRAEFEALTRAEEEAGLYEDTTTIGFKLNWIRLLESKGLVVVGQQLVRQGPVRSAEVSAPVVVVERHKTALTRYELSKPVKSLLEYGLLKPGKTFFDYGCGQGADLRGLQALGYEADGWDPVFRPDAVKHDADVVNLGYVLNVIEDPAERLEALADAYRHAKRVMAVSAMIAETSKLEGCAQFGDGVLTKRNTFQKYFEQQELQQYIEDALETSAIPVSLGTFYVFRDPADQQDFLSARSKRAIDWGQISARLGLGGPPADRWEVLYESNRELLNAFGALALELQRFPSEGEFGRLKELEAKLGSMKRGLRAFVQGGGAKDRKWDDVAVLFGIGLQTRARWEILCEQHKEVLEAYWSLALDLGRTPAAEEFEKYHEVIKAVGSANKAMALFVRKSGEDSLKRSAEARRKDLLVYLAKANLRRKVPFGHLSASLRLDIREFFGNYEKALEEGLGLLYAAGDPRKIEVACQDLKFGVQDKQALYVHRSALDFLPGILRAYVGCAAALFGDVAQADLVKIHKASGKVTFLLYDDFENRALPELQHRVKVNLRTRRVEAYDHRVDGQLLYFKEHFVWPDHPGLEIMTAFSSKLLKLGISAEMGRGPNKAEFAALLEKHGLNEKLNKKRH
ncbi:MAG: DNA phosphorothioation-associated putative methyltransferase [Verrucomicrobiia bacterium]